MTHNIYYTIKPLDPYSHVLAVSCKIQSTNPNGQQFYLPAWAPGSYKIRDFAKYISQVQAQANGQPLACHKIDKHTWQCEPTAHEITFQYQVYAWDLSVRGSHLDQTHATINGSSIFVCPIGAENFACVVDVQRPTGAAYHNWRVATALNYDGTKEHAFGNYHAKNYPELIDSPIELGHFVTESFTEQGIVHELVFSGLAPNTDIKRITQDVQKMCAYYLNLFPKPYPMERYVFLIDLLDQGFGGLEHRASSLLHFSKYGLPTPADKEVNEVYASFLTLCSHEYLHTWLVKSVKPAVFMPYNLNQEAYTELLWLFEGFTAYYEDLALVRSGLITEQQFFTLLAQKISRLWRVPGRQVQSVTEASFDAWIKFYQPDENTINITVSYYLQGSLIALILDIYLRDITENRISLDTILVELWKRYSHQGVSEHTLPELIREYVGSALDTLLQQLLYTTEELPLVEALAKIGVILQQRPAKNVSDKGDVSDKPLSISGPIPVDLGINYDMHSSHITIQQCLNGSPAQRAGLSAGDIIIAIDQLRVEGHTLAKHLARYAPGDVVSVQAFRRDQLMTFSVTLAEAMPVAVLVIKGDVDTGVKERRKLWLGE